MGITAEVEAPRGGLAEKLAGTFHPLVLGNAEIERFEDHHTGIFAIWDGFMSRAAQPTSRQVRDLVALGLVGGSMKDKDADVLVASLGPDQNLRLYAIAQGLLGVALMPDLPAQGGDDPNDAPADDGGDDPEKKISPAPGTCGE